jgi:hypothetical protein
VTGGLNAHNPVIYCNSNLRGQVMRLAFPQG